MQVFINELSLEGQYFTPKEFETAVKTFMGVFSLLNNKVKEKQMYKEQLLLYRDTINNAPFQASFQQITNKELKVAFRNIVFNKLNPKDWREEQVHSVEDFFQWKDELVTDSSMAEIAERKIQNSDLLGLLVNFQKSRFAAFSAVTIDKNKSVQVDVDCIENQNALQTWLENNFHFSTYEYDHTSTESPNDSQTVLRDTTRFKQTSFVNQGRKVYQEIETGFYWCVDNSPYHTGKKAHLEVFNARKEHIGEANLDGEIDFKKKKPGRTL